MHKTHKNNIKIVIKSKNIDLPIKKNKFIKKKSLALSLIYKGYIMNTL